MTEKIIYFNKVGIKLNDNKALKNINLDIITKDFIYLIGKTGSGKSSILRTIYADFPIIQGEAEVLGCDLIKIKKKLLSSGYILNKIDGENILAEKNFNNT